MKSQEFLEHMYQTRKLPYSPKSCSSTFAILAYPTLGISYSWFLKHEHLDTQTSPSSPTQAPADPSVIKPAPLSDPTRLFSSFVIFHLSSVLMVTTFIANSLVLKWWLGTYWCTHIRSARLRLTLVHHQSSKLL